MKAARPVPIIERQVILMPEEVRAIQCRTCGGAMYSDQKAAAYVCAFCGTSVPWTNEQVFWASPITFRHKPVQVIDGAMKLGHVEVMTGVDPHNERVLSQKYRQKSVAGKLALWDDTTVEAFAGVCQLTFVCPFCGGEFTGESTQHFFTCGYCNNTFEDEELVRPGAYRRADSLAKIPAGVRGTGHRAAHPHRDDGGLHPILARRPQCQDVRSQQSRRF